LERAFFVIFLKQNRALFKAESKDYQHHGRTRQSTSHFHPSESKYDKSIIARTSFQKLKLGTRHLVSDSQPFPIHELIALVVAHALVVQWVAH
jgi:hypothetical protein